MDVAKLVSEGTAVNLVGGMYPRSNSLAFEDSLTVLNSLRVFSCMPNPTVI